LLFKASVTEIFFYHLERQPLEKVLPRLIERSLDRGWRVVVRTDSGERTEALSALDLQEAFTAQHKGHGNDRAAGMAHFR
jgi:DNA polymerase-3 subunit chi